MPEFIVIVESRADWQTATELANRVFVETIDWLEADNLQYMFQWKGLEAGTEYSCWKDVQKIIDRAKLSGFKLPRFRGHTRNGEPFKADGAAAMKVLDLVRFLQKTREIQAILFIRDLDNQPDRRQGLEQARKEHCDRKPQLEIILGTANPKREAWVLNGFIPDNPEEEKILEEIKTHLSFDPCTEAHKLRSTSREDSDRMRNPKVILERLTEGKMQREQKCWQNTDMIILRDRGIETTLTNYLEEIEQNLTFSLLK